MYKERDEGKRKEFNATLAQTPASQIVYVDESGMDEFLYREYARAPRGEKVYGVISGKKYKRVSVVAAQCEDRIFAPLEYAGTTDSVLFEYWFEHILLPQLPPGYLVVMDNASFHRKRILSLMVEKSGCSLLFFPPYSPDLNPIEHYWAWLKSKLRDLLPQFSSFDDALMACFQLG